MGNERVDGDLSCGVGASGGGCGCAGIDGGGADGVSEGRVVRGVRGGVRIGFVKYLNTLPLVEGLGCWEGASLTAAVPSKLIGMLLRGEVDVALASVIDAARVGVGGGMGDGRGGGVCLLESGMIGSDGSTFTVRLYSRVPLERVRRLAIDTDSHTSAVLARVVLARRYGVRDVEVTDFDARERFECGGGVGDGDGDGGDRGGGGGWPEALVLIGDKVVTDPPCAGVYGYEVDLGEAWKGLTGLPFVYACWMCRAEECSSDRVALASAVLDRARRHNATRLDWIVAGRAGERHWPTDVAADYVGRKLRYEVDEAAKLSVEKFVGWAFELGLCERGEVRWVGG